MRKTLFLVDHLDSGIFYKTIANILGHGFSSVGMLIDVCYFGNNDEKFHGDVINSIPGQRLFINGQGFFGDKKLMGNFDFYDKYIFFSINQRNARLINKIKIKNKIHVIFTDDEIHRRFSYYIDVYQGHDPESLRLKLGFTLEEDLAFENVGNFIGPRKPWDTMVRFQRRSPVNWFDVLIPFEGGVNPGVKPDIASSFEPLSILVSPKPILPFDYYLSRIKKIIDELSLLDIRVEIFCPVLSPVEVEILLPLNTLKVSITPFLTPIDPSEYYAILNRCSGIYINNRGGYGALLRGVTQEIPIMYLDGDAKLQINYAALNANGVKLYTAKELVKYFHSGKIRSELINNSRLINNLWASGREIFIREFL